MLAAVAHDGAIQIAASPRLITHIARVNGVPHIFLLNLNGLRGGKNAVPTPESDMTVTLPAVTGMRMYYLPFLGKKGEVPGESQGGHLIFRVPPVGRGGLLWLDRALSPEAH